MRKAIDLTGRTIGNWLVLGEHDRRGKNLRYLCRCTLCGAEKPVFKSQLVQTGGASCVCIRAKRRSDRRPVNSTARIWSALKYNGKLPERWHDFEQFLADVGVRPEGGRLARRDSRKPHSKENSFWNATTGVMIEIDGVIKNLSGWAKVAGITREGMQHRYNWGLRGADLIAPKHQGQHRLKPRAKTAIKDGSFDRFAEEAMP